MPKIIIFSYDYPPNNGGISRLCGEIRKELLRRGYAVCAITSCPGPDEPNTLRIAARRGILEVKMLRALKKLVSPGDIVITDTWHPAGMLAELVTKNVFILAHGAEFLRRSGWADSQLWNAYRRHVLEKAKGVIANSRYTRGLVLQCAPKARCVAIPLAVDADYFHPTKEKHSDDDILRICSLSRLEKFKGHDFLIKTIAALPDKYRKRIRLEIGGKGNYKPVLEQLVKALRLDDTVKFLGFMTDDEVLDFYSRNDLFILCTREENRQGNVEGFGLVFTEAQACGTAVVGTRTGGIPDAIEEGRGGWLIPQDDPFELAALLQQFVDDKASLQQMGLTARNRVLSDCTWHSYGDEFIRFLNA